MYFQYSVAFEDRNVRFFIIKQPIAKSFVEMLMVKGFPLRDRIDQKIRQMIELGYLAGCQKIFRDNVSNVTKIADTQKQFTRLEKEHFDGAFVLLGLGLFASLITFLLEFSFNIKKTK